MSVAKPFWLSPRGIRVVGDWSQMLKKAICLGFVKNAEMMVAIVTKGMNMHRTFSVRWTGRDGHGSLHISRAGFNHGWLYPYGLDCLILIKTHQKSNLIHSSPMGSY